MKIDIDGDMIRSVVSEALLRSLDEQKREALIRGAIQKLLEPGTSPYSRGRSEMQEAFDSAVRDAARKILMDQIQTDAAFQAKVHDLMAEAMRKVFEDDRHSTVNRLADAFVSSLYRRD